MNRSWICGAAIIAALMGLSGAAFAQTQNLPIPDGQVAKDLPGAKEMPEPNTTYKVVFVVSKAAPKIDQVNPAFANIIRLVNTLAKNGVNVDHRKIVVVINQQATDIILNNDAFKDRNEGHENPNIATIQKMKKAGVDFRVCGQSVLGHKMDPKTIQPEIELDLWAMTTVLNLEMHGYARMGE